MSANPLAPIVLFVYNRPEHTQRVVEALQKNILAAESELFIFSDAPKNEMAVEKVNEVRKYLYTISGFKSVHVTERQENMGCDPSIIAGISEVISKYGRVIEVEDDVVTAPFFLQYINEALDMFENDERVWSVAGFSPSIKIPANYKDDIYLMPRPNAQGFGYWKNRWDMVEKEIPDIYTIFKDKKMKRLFCGAGDDIVNTMIKNPHTYDIPIFYHIRKYNKYVVVPTHSLVKNIGFDGTGVHSTRGEAKRYDFEVYTGDVSLNPNVQPDERIIRAIKKFYTKPVWRKILVAVAQQLGIYDFLRKKFS